MATGRCSFTEGSRAHTDESQFTERSLSVNRRITALRMLQTVQQSQLHVDPAQHGRITEDSSISFLSDPWRLSNLSDDTTHPVARYDVAHININTKQLIIITIYMFDFVP